MDTQPTKRVIDLDPYEIQDETLAQLKAEVQQQADADFSVEDIEIIATLVLDTTEDGGLDSHATTFTTE